VFPPPSPLPSREGRSWFDTLQLVAVSFIIFWEGDSETILKQVQHMVQNDRGGEWGWFF